MSNSNLITKIDSTCLNSDKLVNKSANQLATHQNYVTLVN